MKNGKNPTRSQKEAIKAAGLNPENWLIFKKSHSEMRLIHRETGTTKTILI
ncbi:hypothetical protein [Bacillus sp. MUM 116]|uniref:DUF6906 family protein n=1 Tax=Bacillus sp. MUM 116 TaxID=1678002 RepID=UPI0015A6CD8B|nr:hypothetical protein [Bacillus sp. MUM 116]